MNRKYLNEFKRKTILNKLSEFDIINILEEQRAFGRVVFHFFVMLEGFVVPVSVTYKNGSVIKEDMTNSIKDLESFTQYAKRYISEKVIYINEHLPFDKCVKASDIEKKSEFLKDLIIREIELYSTFNLATYTFENTDMESECRDSLLDCLKDGVSIYDAYEDFVEHLGVDNKLVLKNLQDYYIQNGDMNV